MVRFQIRGLGLLVAGLTLAAGPLASCSPAVTPGMPAEEPKKNVTLVMKMKDNEYWKTVQMGAEAAT
ncbi:hypothetical protein LJK87_47430 [Paenibacillus sp. P25]|nr:hypothetical protein LJK87_47430 [Paenibacillus sp. P25]